MQKHKKIISIIDHVGKKAGMDYYTSSLANGFLNNNISVYVFSNFKLENDACLKYKNFFENNFNNKILKAISFIFSVTKSLIISRLKNSSVTIVNFFTSDFLTFLLIFFSKIFSKKLIVIAHDIESFKGNNISFFEKIIFNNFADSVIVHNKFCYKKLSEKINNPEKIEIIKQGGYISYFGKMPSMDEASRHLKLDVSKKYILFFGQIKKDKGLDILINALKDVNQNIHLIIAGKNTDSDFLSYKKLIKNNGIEDRVIVKNYFISNTEMKNLFSCSSAIILPYKKIYQSAVILMSMSLNLPVISSDLEPIKEVICNNEDGITFSSENSIDLAEKINTTVVDENLLKKISANAMNKIKNQFDWNVISSQYAELIDKL